MLKILLKLLYISICLIRTIAGQGQVVRKSPVYQLGSDGHKYNCKFHNRVDCFWMQKGTTISISVNKYRYFSGNGINTTDCSIIANTPDAKLLSETECKGVIHYIPTHTIHTDLDQSLILNCSSSRSINCGWKRNNQSMKIDGRYENLNNITKSSNKNCALRINGIKELDLGVWECTDKSDDKSDAETIVKYHLNGNSNIDILNSTETTTLSEQSVTPEGTSNCKFLSDCPNALLYLSLGAAFGIIIILAGTVFYLCRRQKLQKKRKRLDQREQKPVEIVSDNLPVYQSSEEPTYMNVTNSTSRKLSQPEATSTPLMTRAKREKDKLLAKMGLPNNKKPISNSCVDVSHRVIGNVEYAIIKKRLSQDFSTVKKLDI